MPYLYQKQKEVSDCSHKQLFSDTSLIYITFAAPVPVSSAPVAVLLVAALLAPVLSSVAASAVPAAVLSALVPDRYLQSSQR